MTPEATNPDTHKHSFRRSWVFGLVAALVILVGYVFTAAPLHIAQLRTQVSDGSTSQALSSTAKIDIPKGWTVRPLPHETARLPGSIVLRDPTILFGNTRGIELIAPNGEFTIEVSAMHAATRPVFEKEARNLLHPRPKTDDSRLLTESLASGAHLVHIDTPTQIVAGVGLSDDSFSVLINARLLSSEGKHSELTAYRPALSSILESIQVKK